MSEPLVVTDAVLLNWARNSRLRTALPFLRQIHRAVTRTGGCRCRKTRSSPTAALAAAKAALGANPALVAQVKRATGVAKLKLRVKVGAQIEVKEV